MRDNSLVSVIVPVYNVQEYLNECIDSVISQTYTQTEIILIDDGSTDNSGKICDDYARKDSRIKVIHKENGGLSEARNTGVKNATGKYIYFIDSDDYILPDTLKELTDIAEAEDADIVYFDAKSFEEGEKGFNIEQRYIRKKEYKTDEGFKVFEALQNNKEYHPSVCLLFFNKKFFDENKLEFVSGIYHEDMIFTYIALCLANRVAQCKKAFYMRRYRNESITVSRKNEKHFNGLLCVYNKVKDFSQKNNLSDLSAGKKYIARCAYNALNVYKKLDKDNKKKFKNDYRKLKEDILFNGAFGDTALKMRCHSELRWFIYKVFEKTAGRVLGK